jgi:hypothetical protein
MGMGYYMAAHRTVGLDNQSQEVHVRRNAVGRGIDNVRGGRKRGVSFWLPASSAASLSNYSYRGTQP